jgi:trans-aconitate 2-methyltransferase
MQTHWNPASYLAFDDHRTRPAIDLLSRINFSAPRSVIDLGCGPGNSTRLLRDRWPDADVTGVDSSVEMLEQARRSEVSGTRRITWEQRPIERWAPATPPDVIFSNAALHWVDDHERRFPQLVGLLAQGGVLAVQMPHRDGRQAFARALQDIALEGPWRDRFRDFTSRPSATPGEYHDWLAPHVDAIDIWTTEYLHVLTGEDPVWRWTSTTAQRPYVERLDLGERDAFGDAYRHRLRECYPRRDDGTTLLPFLRLFIVARRK